MKASWILLFLVLHYEVPLCHLKCDETLKELKPNTYKKLLKNKSLMQVVTQKFMSFLGVSGKTNGTGTARDRVHVPEHMWKLFYKWNNENEKEKEIADTALLLHNENDEIGGRLNFDLSPIPMTEKVHRAELMLYTEPRRGVRPHKVFRLYKPKFNDDRLIAYYKKIRNARKGYVKIDITDLIQDWKVNGVENSSMIIEIDRNANTLNSVHTRRRRNIADDEWLRKRPMLTVYTMSANNARKKPVQRSRRNVPSGNIYITASEMKRLNKTHQKVKRETCRLRPYSLNFKDFGWDEWIIAPHSYNLNYCSGMCPRPLGPHFNTTNHAVIQNAVLGINKQLVPPLCCIPTTFKDQTFLFVNSNGKLLLKKPVEMIAQGCGCH